MRNDYFVRKSGTTFHPSLGETTTYVLSCLHQWDLLEEQLTSHSTFVAREFLHFYTQLFQFVKHFIKGRKRTRQPADVSLNRY